MATILWDIDVRPESALTAAELIRRIWRDMEHYAGYLSHRLLQDADRAGHFVIVSEWADRAIADRIRDEYAQAESVRLLAPLLAAPRIRLVLDDLP